VRDPLLFSRTTDFWILPKNRILRQNRWSALQTAIALPNAWQSRGKTQAALMIFASYVPRLLFGAP
jgi:hypothetical protein